MDELSKLQPSISLEHLIAIDRALTELEALGVFGISERMVIREWRLAQAFPFQSLGSKP